MTVSLNSFRFFLVVNDFFFTEYTYYSVASMFETCRYTCQFFGVKYVWVKLRLA